jgi:imidazolonepropionase-like amidohydrolase
MIASEKLANIKSVADGSRVAIIAADSKLEIRSALSLAKQHNIQAALFSKGRVGEFAKQLADQDISLIVPSFSGKEYDAQYEQIMQAQRAGVELAFAGDSPEKIRATAALLVNAGLDPELALLALTEGGGQTVGMKNIGLSKGATADFIVWSDSPLNLAAKPLAVVVDGQIVTEK